MVLHTSLWYISLFSGCWNIVGQLTTFLLFKTRVHHYFDYIVIHAILYIESTACQHEITNFMVLHNVHNPNSSHQNLFTGLGVERSNPSCRILFTSHQVNLKVKFLKQGCQFIFPKSVYKTSPWKSIPPLPSKFCLRDFLCLSSRAGDQYCQRQDANQWQEAEIVLAGSHHLIVVMLLVRSPSSSARKRTYILPEDFLVVFSLSKSMSYPTPGLIDLPHIF